MTEVGEAVSSYWSQITGFLEVTLKKYTETRLASTLQAKELPQGQNFAYFHSEHGIFR